ncbi:MAG: 4Fe-4S binding protein [Methanospirillum sp.]|nr:4Fe-4S binding protein [Methanospirillum sp.]
MTGTGQSPAKTPGTILQKQKGYVALRLHAVGGEFTSAQMRAIAGVAERYGRGRLHLTTRQGIEIHCVPLSGIEPAVGELEDAGVAMGADGPRVRLVTACPGAETCRRGIFETKEVAARLDREFFAQPAPYKFKIAVTGCPNNCAKATENDIGVMGAVVPAWNGEDCDDCGACEKSCPVSAIGKIDGEYVVDPDLCLLCGRCISGCPREAWTVARRGFVLWIGGTMGKTPRLADRIDGLIESTEELYWLVGRAFAYYRENGRPKERFGRMIDRIGRDTVVREITRRE